MMQNRKRLRTSHMSIILCTTTVVYYILVPATSTTVPRTTFVKCQVYTCITRILVGLYTRSYTRWNKEVPSTTKQRSLLRESAFIAGAEERQRGCPRLRSRAQSGFRLLRCGRKGSDYCVYFTEAAGGFPPKYERKGEVYSQSYG